jgi:hypothetical protein
VDVLEAEDLILLGQIREIHFVLCAPSWGT